MSGHARVRKNLGLTQTAATSRAKLSLATWRRWEADPESVTKETREACEQVLAVRPLNPAGGFEHQWSSVPEITPRQAYALSVVLGVWADDLNAWVASTKEPLHRVGPSSSSDRGVMFHIGENRAYAAETGVRCAAVADEIADGVLPFAREGRFIDEVLMGAAFRPAQALLDDTPELCDSLAARPGHGDDEVGDGDWDALSDWFDDEAHAPDWEVPLGLPSLPLLLEARHPFTWFDIHRDPPSHSELPDQRTHEKNFCRIIAEIDRFQFRT